MKLPFIIIVCSVFLWVGCVTKKKQNIKNAIIYDQVIDTAAYIDHMANKQCPELLELYDSTVVYLNSIAATNTHERLPGRILLFSAYKDSTEKSKLAYSFFPQLDLYHQGKEFGSIAFLSWKIEKDMWLKSITSKGNYQAENFQSKKDSATLTNIYCRKLSKTELDTLINNLINSKPSDKNWIRFTTVTDTSISLKRSDKEWLSFTLGSFFSYPTLQIIYANLMMQINDSLSKRNILKNPPSEEIKFKLVYKIGESYKMFYNTPEISRSIIFYQNSKDYSYNQILELFHGIHGVAPFDEDIIVGEFDRFIGQYREHNTRTYSYFKRIK